MSDRIDNNSFEEKKSEQEVQQYRQRRVDEFKLSIHEQSSGASQQSDKDGSAKPETVSNEITSFSDENTKAQIERNSKKTLKLQKKEEKKVIRIKSGRNKKVYRIAWLVMILMVSVALSSYLITGVNDFFARFRTEDSTVNIVIGKNDDINDISKKLRAKGVINSTEFFTLFAKVTGKDDTIEPGVYEVATNRDYLGVLNYLRNTDNRKTTITLQVAEGTSILQLSNQLYDAGITSDKNAFLSLCNSDTFDEDYSFLADIQPNADRVYKLEGYLFPDTYEFYVDEDPDITIRRFLKNFKDKVYTSKFSVKGYSELMTIDQLAARSDYSLDQIVTMASMVQRESANVDDMYLVSSVIHNRLEHGQEHDIHTLGLDSTAFYPYSGAEAVPDDMKNTFKSKYDTYDNGGLTPGAICSTGTDALIAAVSPTKTDYLYFCHGTSGSTVTSYYAETYAEHQANLQKAGLAD